MNKPFQYSNTENLPIVDEYVNRFLVDISKEQLLLDVNGKRLKINESKSDLSDRFLSELFPPIDLPIGIYTVIGSLTLSPGGIWVVSAGSEVNCNVDKWNTLRFNGKCIHFNCSAGGGACITQIFLIEDQEVKVELFMLNSIEGCKNKDTWMKAAKIV